MTHKHIFAITGNGDPARGKALLTAFARRLQEARSKHPWPEACRGPVEASRVVLEEAQELACAVDWETPERAADEALDVMVTAARTWNREWRGKKKQHGK